jgi:hypothetical protein
VPETLHLILIALARLVRYKLISSLASLAPLMHLAANHFRWGEHRGGMFVEVTGVGASGEPLKRCWHLLAEGDDGPLIPAMAVEALMRRSLDGHPPRSGARASLRDLELEDYERLFSKRAIYCGVHEESSAGSKSLFARILGPAFAKLPAEIQLMHDGTRSAAGRATIARGRGWLSRLAGSLIGFPKASPDTPVKVDFAASAGSETWTRTFGDDVFSSRMSYGQGRSEGLLCESFGPLKFAMALVEKDQRLLLVMRRWSAFGLPLPMWLCLRLNSYETIEDGRFSFHVEISHPLTGLIVRYQGQLSAS